MSDFSLSDPEDRVSSMRLKLTSKQAEITVCEVELQAALEKQNVIRTREAERRALVAEISRVRREQTGMEVDSKRLRMEILATNDSEFDVEKDQLIADLAREWKLKASELAELESKLEALV